MRKQIGFDLRSWNLTPAAVEDNTQTRKDMLEFIATNYKFEDGWEIFSVHVTHTNGMLNVAIAFVQYEVEPEVASISASKAKA